MSQGYTVTNALTGLAATAFTWSSGYTTNRGRLNDGILDELAASGATAQASGQTLAFDLGAAAVLSGVAILNHNLISGGTCTVIVEADTGPTFATAVTVKAETTVPDTAPNHKDCVLQFAGNVSKRYWRITFIHDDEGAKIITIGELLALGNANITALSRSSIYGDGEAERAIVNRNVSQLGHQRATFVGGPVRTKRRLYKNLSTSEKAELRAMWAASNYGVSNMLWIEYIEATADAATAAAQECLWGKIEPDFDWTQDDYRLFDFDGFTLTGQGREVGS